jgi:hypothetical protein
MKPPATTPTPPLKMLYDLLEEYAPSWVHKRASRQSGGRSAFREK